MKKEKNHRDDQTKKKIKQNNVQNVTHRNLSSSRQFVTTIVLFLIAMLNKTTCPCLCVSLERPNDKRPKQLSLN